MKVDGARWAWEKETSVSYILQQQTATYTLLLQIIKRRPKKKLKSLFVHLYWPVFFKLMSAFFFFLDFGIYHHPRWSKTTTSYPQLFVGFSFFKSAKWLYREFQSTWKRGEKKSRKQNLTVFIISYAVELSETTIVCVCVWDPAVISFWCCPFLFSERKSNPLIHYRLNIVRLFGNVSEDIDITNGRG